MLSSATNLHSVLKIILPFRAWGNIWAKIVTLPWFAAVVAGLCTGCVALSSGPAVDLSVVSVRPLASTLLETRVELTLRLTNATAQSLAFVGSTHKLYVNDTYVGRAVSSERVTVPPFGTSMPAVTVFIENLALIRKATEFSRAPDRIAYRLESRWHPLEGAPYGDVKVIANGELDLAGLGIALPPPAR